MAKKKKKKKKTRTTAAEATTAESEISTFEIGLDSFSFPATLDPDKANFRLAVEIDYEDKSGKLQRSTPTLPSMDSWWECDWRKADDLRYVGPEPPAGPPSTSAIPGYGSIVPEKLDPHRRVMDRLQARRILSLHVTVYDVDRRDVWDSIQAQLATIVSSLLERGLGLLPLDTSLSKDVTSALQKKLAGTSDRVAFEKGIRLDASSSTRELLEGRVRQKHYAGMWRIGFSIKTI